MGLFATVGAHPGPAHHRPSIRPSRMLESRATVDAPQGMLAMCCQSVPLLYCWQGDLNQLLKWIAMLPRQTMPVVFS